jgi:RimJ/RimL family protein N-acetyltransferase
MSFSLLQLSKTELEALAASIVPEGMEGRTEQDSLPPAFVAMRSIELAAAGQPTPWSTTFLIVNNTDFRIVGGCGFKTAPHEGRVEVGYGVSPKARGMGAATEALLLLVQKGFDTGAREVLAEVASTNTASTRVVQKAGFSVIGARVDDDNEHVIQWIKRSVA